MKIYEVFIWVDSKSKNDIEIINKEIIAYIHNEYKLITSDKYYNIQFEYKENDEDDQYSKQLDLLLIHTILKYYHIKFKILEPLEG